MTSYVHDHIEVVLTGRTAVRELKGGRSSPKSITLVEITPAGDTDGWKKWVDPSTLFVVSDTQNAD